MNKIKAFLLASFILTASVSLAQNGINTIDNQFNSMLNESSDYKTFKVVQLHRLKELQQNANDSLKALQTTIAEDNVIITQQIQVTDSLNNQLTALKIELNGSSNENDQIVFLGISFNKSIFQFIVLGILLLAVLLVFAFQYRFKSNLALTRTTSKRLKEIENEFEQFRVNSMEREQKLRRQLIDETNKNKENKNKDEA